MTLDEMIVAAQSIVDGLNAVKAAPETAAMKVTEVDVTESDGKVEKFVPETV